jgi:hypothetical protein
MKKDGITPIKKIKISKNIFYQYFLKIDKYVNFLNTNTLFVGLMMFTMNIASRFVTIKLSRSMEGYMKYSFSKDILVFTIAFIGTRNVYWALLITLIFIICMDYLFNEESMFCCLPESFTSKHITLLESNANNPPSGMPFGVPPKNNSISGAPGLGYSTGSNDSKGHNMQQNELLDNNNWGELTEDEKQKITQVLNEMRTPPPVSVNN